MPQFAYKARDPKGAAIEGTMDAVAKTAVVTRLQQMGYFPVAVKEADGKAVKAAVDAPSRGSGPARPQQASSAPGTATRPAASAPRGATKAQQAPTRSGSASKAAAPGPVGGGSRRRGKVTLADVVSFNRQLADLITSGIPLVKGLAILSRQAESPAFREIIEMVLQDVQGGKTFADALAVHGKVFSKLYIAMVKSGEAGGMLDQVLSRLADHSEAEEQVRSRIKSALAYPLVMVGASGVALIVMFTYVIPRIVETFRQMEQSLPFITQVLITVSDFVQHWWWAVIAGIAGAALLAWRFLVSPAGRMLWHRTVLRLPVMGEIVRKRQVSLFARTLGSLLRNGVSILSALEITREVLDNELFRHEVDRIAEEITQGSSVATPLRESAVFPQVAVNMISVGEETGRLPDVLLRISDSYETEVDRLVRTMTGLLEPIIIVGMGLVVGFIVIAMLFPLFTMDPSGGRQ